MVKNERISKFFGAILVQIWQCLAVPKPRNKNGSHWTIDHVPNHGKKPYRLRWKNLKPFGDQNDEDLKRVHYFATATAAKDFAEKKIEVIQYLGILTSALEPKQKADILREAARLVGRGIDPIAAMEEGAKHLKAYGEQAEIEIGSFWPAYVERKKDAGKWGARNLKAQETFYKITKETFMRQRVKVFIYATNGKKVVKDALEQYRQPHTRNAQNTVRGAKSKMRTFLAYIASEVDALKSATIKEIFDGEYILPLRTRSEAANVAITTDQAKYLIGYLASRKLAGWIVFKLFMGARTLLVQEWKWSILDFEKELVRIPKHQTKLKKNEIRFSLSEIPNFANWVKWAWQLDGCPKPEERIARFSQPTITKHVANAINEKKDLFTTDKRKKIKPAESLRNFMRSGFITYGTQIPALGVGKVMKIAEDAHNLHKYLAWDSASGPEPEAEKFWNLTPSEITIAPPPPHTRRRRKSPQITKAAFTL